MGVYTHEVLPSKNLLTTLTPTPSYHFIKKDNNFVKRTINQT